MKTKSSTALKAQRARSKSIGDFVAFQIIDEGYARPIYEKVQARAEKARNKYLDKHAPAPIVSDETCARFIPNETRAKKYKCKRIKREKPVVFDVVYRDKKRNVLKVLKDLTGDTNRFPIINGYKPVIVYH